MALTHREEKILEAVIDGSSVPFDPITRREKIFAKAAGEDIELAPPITKEEQILSALAAKGSGGGGSSDFSTAEVTLINANTAGAYQITLLRLTDDGLALGKINVQASEPVIVNIPLYKGKCTFSLIVDDVDMAVMPTTTGGVEIDFNTPALIITGNGTFTAKGTLQHKA